MEMFLTFGTIQTVLGSISPENLGTTITHEHLLFDQSPFLSVPEDPLEKIFFINQLTKKTWDLFVTTTLLT